MYNSPDLIFDNEVSFVSYNQTINHVWTCEDLILSNLWYITQIDDLIYKCIPLFNCDIIRSSNESDIVLGDNKCLILNFDEETRITCTANDTGSIHYHDIQLCAYTAYTKLDVIDELTVYCIVYDKYLNTLNNVLIDVLIDDVIISTITTNNEGVCRFKINKTCNMQFKYGDTESNIIHILGD